MRTGVEIDSTLLASGPDAEGRSLTQLKNASSALWGCLRSRRSAMLTSNLDLGSSSASVAALGFGASHAEVPEAFPIAPAMVDVRFESSGIM